jgi:hypothetical protein
MLSNAFSDLIGWKENPSQPRLMLGNSFEVFLDSGGWEWVSQCCGDSLVL